MERYLYRSMASYGFTWLMRPAVMVLLVLAATSFFFAVRGRMKSVARPAPAGDTAFARK